MKTSQPHRRAEPGAVIVIAGHRVGDQRRKGEILDVLGSPEHEHYRVRWEEGSETIFYPGASDATIEPRRADRGKTTSPKQRTADVNEPDSDEPVLVHEP
jgi:Domain of unknown function (DUF1918)